MNELPVLLVEDEVLVQDLIREALEEAGYRVISVEDARAAVSIIEQESGLAGMVTDINLGAGPQGWEIARAAREKHPNLPIVYVSGDSMHDWSSHGVPHSVMVPKPFANAQIVVALAEMQDRPLSGV
ncbi:response regulator [Phenylobacterium sp.]|jgi:two-component system cell cycle response regulator CpdR|uniref:response regulator n=1 Tax=Phenylobacterium sp. TaxID=1871053 RepID=UPI003784205C